MVDLQFWTWRYSMSLATSVFGKGGKYYLSISLDNRIKLIDVQTGTEKHSFVEKHHLSHSYTCCSWGQKNKDDLGHFAVGSSDGMIIVWDLTRGVSKSIGKANEFPVPTDVRLSRDMKCVFVSSSASHIVEYEIATGTQKRSFKSSKKGSQRLCMNPVVDAFAFASGSIRMVDIDSGRKRKLQSSFTGDISCLEFSDNGCYIAYASESVREVVLYDIQYKGQEEDDTNEEEGNIAPLCVIPISNIAKKISIRVTPDSASVDVLVMMDDAGSNNSNCVITRVFQSGDRGDVRYVQSVIQSDTLIENAEFSDVNSICFGTKGVSNNNIPNFCSIQYVDPNSNTLQSNIYLSSLPAIDNIVSKSTSESSASNGLNTNTETTIIGAFEIGSKKRPMVDEAKSASLDIKKIKQQNSDNDNEETLEQRLTMLSNDIDKIIGQEQHVSEMTPTSDSLVTLIEQALQTNDDIILEQCLSQMDNNIIEETTKRLPYNKIIILISKLIIKFEKKPTRGILLTRWLTCILRIHATYLLTVPDLNKKLAGLVYMLENRISTYTNLVSLAGRLDILMSSSSAAKSVNNSHTKLLSNVSHDHEIDIYQS